MSNIRENIDKMIMEQMKLRNKEKAEVYKAIKNQFLIHKTAKNAKPLDDATEITILQKMVKQREDAASQFIEGNRQDLADKEKYEIEIISELMPKAPTKEDIEAFVNEKFPDGFLHFQMGVAIRYIKETLIGADGKLVADIVKSKVKQNV